jgi:hypothetical protein
MPFFLFRARILCRVHFLALPCTYFLPCAVFPLCRALSFAVRFSRSLPCVPSLPCVLLSSDGKDFFAVREIHGNVWLHGSGRFSHSATRKIGSTLG